LAPQAKAGSFHEWWGESFPGGPLKSKDAKQLPQIRVSGNKFVTEKNDTILFRGLSIADPDKIEHQGQWNKDLFVRIKKLGTMVVRIPVHPIAWRERTPEKYLQLLDQAVDWCTQAGLYVDIDWHSIGNLQQDLYQDPMYNTSKAETFNFWKTIANHFSGHNTVAFLELFNEPTDYRGKLGTASWDEWKKINEDLIRLIRANDNQGIPLVAGFDWAYDLTPLNTAPINAQGIGYVTHPYPHKRTPPYEPKWEENFGFAANNYPVIATEIGFTLGGWNGNLKDNGEYGKAIINYLEGKGISWIWWVYDPQWTPSMIESWETFKLTDSGNFYEEVLKHPAKH
jgi:aryl-phospho-beta-D-glucosidase BglC (GH1 family)